MQSPRLKVAKVEFHGFFFFVFDLILGRMYLMFFMRVCIILLLGVLHTCKER